MDHRYILDTVDNTSAFRVGGLATTDMSSSSHFFNSACGKATEKNA